MTNLRAVRIFVVAFIAGTAFGAATCPYLPGKEQRLANENRTLEELLESARKEIADLKRQLKR